MSLSAARKLLPVRRQPLSSHTSSHQPPSLSRNPLHYSINGPIDGAPNSPDDSPDRIGDSSQAQKSGKETDSQWQDACNGLFHVVCGSTDIS